MEKLADRENNFSQWYQDVLAAAQLVDHGPVRGTMVIRPYGYAIWENIQKILDKKIKEHDVQNAYFPLLIPQSFITKEAEHVKGFSPELAVVTHAGGKELEEPLVIRPTSETIVYSMFSKWIKSWRDLPLKLNQWASIVRWEMRPRLFIRTTEILWQEGHTAHSSFSEAEKMAKAMLDTYTDFISDYLAIPVIKGEKSASERFAGADATFTMESMMGDGKALQMGTTHLLSQKFSSAFNISYQAKDGSIQTPFCTSWGIATRLIGALIMVHGDQTGLVIPPKLAPYQVVIVPIFKSDDEKKNVIKKAQEIKEKLQREQISIIVDDDEQKTPGAKFFHWEVRGVPLRIEIGPRDVEQNQVVIVKRIGKPSERKVKVSFEQLETQVKVLLDQLQEQLLVNAKKWLENNWYHADELVEFGSQLAKKSGFYQTGWCGDEVCEAKLKKFKGTIRCLLEETQHASCFACGKKSLKDVLVAKAY